MDLNETAKLDMPHFDEWDYDDLYQQLTNLHIPADEDVVLSCIDMHQSRKHHLIDHHYFEDPAGYIYKIEFGNLTITRKL